MNKKQAMQRTLQSFGIQSEAEEEFWRDFDETPIRDKYKNAFRALYYPGPKTMSVTDVTDEDARMLSAIASKVKLYQNRKKLFDRVDQLRNKQGRE